MYSRTGAAIRAPKLTPLRRRYSSGFGGTAEELVYFAIAFAFEDNP
jgi:hypothetical protein